MFDFFGKRPNQSRKPQYRQIALQKKGNRRRLWRLAVATQPRTTSRLSLSCGFRGAGPIS